MSTGTGIAIAAMWAFALGCAMSKNVTGFGMALGVVCALIGTWGILMLVH